MRTYKNDFPIFTNNPDLIFLDSAASSQKPQQVLDDITYFCKNHYANVHRGAYSLSLQSTHKIETARQEIAEFFGTKKQNLIFTKNATEASNLFISGILQYIQTYQNSTSEPIEILMPLSEHHSSLLPALIKTQYNKQIIIRYIYPNSSGIFHETDFEKHITHNTRLIICAHISNVTGQKFDIHKISHIIQQKKKQYNMPLYFAVDASQSAPHTPITFDSLLCDAMFITGHKLGAGGIGALLVSHTVSNILSPLCVGGGIVHDVHEHEYSFLESPTRFEAGTPSIENIIGFHSAIEYLKNISFEKIIQHEKQLTQYALEQFAQKLPHFTLLGDKNYTPVAPNKSSIISFYHPTIHHSDIAILLAEKNIAVRSGMHCANPFHHYFKLKGTVRASFWIYNTHSDIDALIQALQEIEKMFVS